MALSGEVQGAIPSVPGFDSDTVITASLAQQFYANGYKFCLRYLSLAEELPQDLSTQEATDILNSGLALMPVQHVREPGWFPSQGLGNEDGQNAAANAQNVGFPVEVNIWCDLEGVNPAADVAAVLDYCRAWYNAVNVAGYTPGLYVGYDTLLNGQQLYDLPFQHYWRSQSSVPDIPTRGYQLLQLFPSIIANGIAIDLDVTRNDAEGGQAQWVCRAG